MIENLTTRFHWHSKYNTDLSRVKQYHLRKSLKRSSSILISQNYKTTYDRSGNNNIRSWPIGHRNETVRRKLVDKRVDYNFSLLLNYETLMYKTVIIKETVNIGPRSVS